MYHVLFKVSFSTVHHFSTFVNFQNYTKLKKYAKNTTNIDVYVINVDFEHQPQTNYSVGVYELFLNTYSK